MPYQPLLIANFRDGQREDAEPWLLPADAYEEMLDCYLENGVLKKRLGYVELDRFVEAAKTITGATTADPVVVSSASHGLANGTLIRITGVDGTTQLNGNLYVVSNAAAGTFELKDLAGEDVDGSGYTAYTSGGIISVYTTDAIVGLMRYIDTNGVEQLLVANEDRLCSYNISGQYLEPVVKVGCVIGIGDGATVAYNITVPFIPVEQLNASAIVVSTVAGSTVTFTGNAASPCVFAGAGIGAGPNDLVLATGVLRLTWAVAPDAGTPIVITYTYYGDLFGGNAGDLFKWENYDDKLWFTNGSNDFLYYDGTAAVVPLIDPDNEYGSFASTGKIIGCKDIKTAHERLMLFGTREGATWHYQRIRWPQAGSVYKWSDLIAGQGDYIDVSTGEHFVAAQYLRDQIIATFDRSIWNIRYTGDPNLAFRLDRMNASERSDAPYALVKFDDTVIGLGTASLFASDGASIKRIDDKIPSFALDIDQDYIQRCFGVRLIDEDQMWLLYPSGTTGDPNELCNRILVWNYKDNAFSIYRLPLCCIGEFYQTADKTLASFPGKTLRDLSGTRLNSFLWQSKAPLLIGGSHAGGRDGGKVWIMNFGSIDAFSNAIAAITDATAANPCVITTAYAHGLQDDDGIKIAGIASDGMIELNDRLFTITRINATSFSLNDVNATDYTAYTSGGYVYRADGISFELKTAQWNPYNQEGKDTRLGWVDFYVTEDEEDSVSVEWFINDSDTSYQTKTLTFDGSGKKTWKRLSSGRIGNTHSLRISDASTSGEYIELHAMRLGVEPAGRGTL